VRETALILKERGYEVRTAKDGFQALVELRRSRPDVIISDLRMPSMSGFELLPVVRRRFPHIPVIAISGEYNGAIPPGLIADAFFFKGSYTPEEMFQSFRRSPSFSSSHRFCLIWQNRTKLLFGYREMKRAISL
jgi:DNA-binding NarL/FixJ family response regulator